MAREVIECRIEQCVKPTGAPGTAKGLCRAHYYRLQTYGDPLQGGPKHLGYPANILTGFTQPNGPDGCWIWRRRQFTNGYGNAYVSVDQRSVLAHRAVYEYFRGAVPEGMQLDHLCRTRLCVNPDHLEPVTAAMNLARDRASSGFDKKCRRGHVFADVGTYDRPDGFRECLACRRRRERGRSRGNGRESTQVTEDDSKAAQAVV